MSWDDLSSLEGVTFLYALDSEEDLGLGLVDKDVFDDDDESDGDAWTTNV
jgi:hypothetical protein